MSSFADLLPNPLKTITAPFDKREGQPWLQGTARNFGHAAFGDKIGNYVDQNYLGDPAQGATGPQTPMAAQMQAQVTPQAGLQQPQVSIQALLEQLMRAKGGAM